MPRTSIGILLAIGLLPSTSLTAQHSFPSPAVTLHDVKFKAAKPAANDDAGKPRVSSDRIIVINGRPVMLRSGPTRIDSLAFSHDGKLLAAGKELGRLVLWDLTSQKIVCTIDTGLTAVGHVAISPDGQFVAVATHLGSTIKLWHIPDGQLANTIDLAPAMIMKMIYGPDAGLLILSSEIQKGYDPAIKTIAISTSTDLINTSSGKSTRSFVGESNPVLSSDGNALLTVNGPEIVLRNVADWKVERTLPKLTDFEKPVFLNLQQQLFLFEDNTDEHLFAVANSTDGQLLPDAKLSKLPNSWIDNTEFAAMDPQTGLVFGHSAGQLWALDLKTGNTCLSTQLLSDSAALSPDGRLLAGAFDSDSATEDQKQAGVNIWRTDALAKGCRLR